MIKLNGKQALFIDVANNFGLDKKEFEMRLAFTEKNIDKLEEMILDADEPIAFMKSVMALRDAQAGKPSGHLVEFDSTTSGVQIMSALTGCYTGGLWTNLIDPSKRYDCYTEAFKAILAGLKSATELTRSMAKNALMTYFYGSTAEPEKELGVGSVLLDEFYYMCSKKLRGAYELRNDLIEVWDPEAEEYIWGLPDGFKVVLRVVNSRMEEIHVDELGYTFFQEFKEVGTRDHAVMLAANVVHSIDAYMVREMHRRCNYTAFENVTGYNLRDIADKCQIALMLNTKPLEPIDLSTPMSLRTACEMDIEESSFEEIYRANKVINDVLSRKSFELITIHDAFKSLPNHVQSMREHYREILAELAESDLLSSIFSDLTGEEEEYANVRNGLTKTEMAAYIRKSVYCIC
ncbi:RNA polymerase [Vibrio phage 1.097.O._10N.286.49.B3]|uniref:DNA-directed RNA polymerase n=1 Tax=Vibrio phage 1.097.O._10N.286.49.B3 TaxID=1881383 RepID=A0A2I7R0R4_9CAUD|nr:RNA polymerase [Vibrio phage 1.097.O._10N.286.49.B3]AUR87229.1 coil containing protein [Vibrio phage 1.097.O._10N.286.49.B3]